MSDKYTPEELKAIQTDLSNRVSFLITNDEGANKELETTGRLVFELMKFARVGLSQEANVGQRAVDKLEEAFLLIKEGVYRDLRDNGPKPEPVKEEKSRIITPNGSR